jgi:hypothetical protein
MSGSGSIRRLPPGVIARSSFSEMSGNAVQTKGGSLNIEIGRNLMTDAGERAVNMGGLTGLQYFRPALSASSPNYEAKDIRVIANVIIGGTTRSGSSVASIAWPRTTRSSIRPTGSCASCRKRRQGG